MPGYAASSRSRVASGLLSALIVGAIGWALLSGLGVARHVAGEAGLALFDATPPVHREPPPRPDPKRNRRPEGAAAPPNLRARPTEVVAPVPVVPLPVPPPVIAAPVAGPGAAPSAGAADRPGPGTGAGGVGTGFGSGGGGDGDGGGWDDETPPRRLRGRIRDADFPREAAEAGAGGVVSVRYYVEVDGRPTGCTVTRSSGSAALDATTCRLIEQRFRYRPSLDGRGRPVRSVVVVDHEWVVEEDRTPSP
jgi:periplasmic protein TonB